LAVDAGEDNRFIITENGDPTDACGTDIGNIVFKHLATLCWCL